MLLCLGVWSVLQAQKKEALLTLAQVLTGLQTQGTTPENRTITARNRYIARRIRERGVTFPLTVEFESELRNAGASDELLKAIRENSPPPKPTPTPPAPKPNLTPTPKPTKPGHDVLHKPRKLPLRPPPSSAEPNRDVLPKPYIENLNGVSLEMIAVPGGSFQMGSNNGSDNEKPAHQVTVSSFAMGKYEVTQSQWQAVMGNNPSSFKGDDLPVENVSWEEAQAFCRKLSQHTGQTYRLPTEAEWEYACRAGSTGDYAGNFDAMAWYNKNSGSKTHVVGQKQPNAWGLYDMHGNVWEWCQDWYGSNYYSQSPSTDPQGPSSGSLRVIRGGGWGIFAANCRSASRLRSAPDERAGHLGFRLLRTAR